MPATDGLSAEQLRSFTVPHVLRILGEHQHLIGSGSVLCAVDRRLHVQVRETPDEFRLEFQGLSGWYPDEQETPGRVTEAWHKALGELVVPDPEMMEGLDICVDFTTASGVPTAPARLPSPAMAAALATAIIAHRGRGRARSEQDLAEMASSVCHAVVQGPMGDTGRYYGEALMSLTGGAAYVEPHGQRLNVQRLLPPESLLLVVRRGLSGVAGEQRREERVLAALAATQQQGTDIMAPGEEGVAALFGMEPGVLDEGQVTMLYGLLRIRQMIDDYLEYLSEGIADNDRLAEICDEESAILKDYFGFPHDAYSRVLDTASSAGALGAKLTWAFGGYPAALIIAPGLREQVAGALGREQDAEILPVDVEPAGLMTADDAQI
jgi:hypothetical protein